MIRHSQLVNSCPTENKIFHEIVANSSVDLGSFHRGIPPCVGYLERANLVISRAVLSDPAGTIAVADLTVTAVAGQGQRGLR